MSLVDELEGFFLVRDYTWRIGGELQTPTAEDIQKVVDHAKEVLDKQESPNVQLEIGRLLFMKRDGITDLYVYFGEIDE